MEFRVDFSSLVRAAQKMGAQPREYPLEKTQLRLMRDVSIQLEHGIDVELKDIEINDGGLLGYQGHQVVLYIPDQGSRVAEVLENGFRGRKVHVANCLTLDEMKRRGRFERYVVRNGLSSSFPVTGKNRGGEDIEGHAELAVCMNCLKLLNYKNFKNKNQQGRKRLVQEFSLDRFFATYSSYFKHMPSRRADQLETNRYSDDWPERSRRYRESKDWKCEGCDVQLSNASNKSLLHTHHLNGVRGDDSVSNLKALCVDCHSKEEMHEHMFVSHGNRRIIQALRTEQGLYNAPRKGSTSRTDWREARQHADPAVHGLLFQLEALGHEVPQIGADIFDERTRRTIYSNAEMVWHDTRELVVLQRDDDCEQIEQAGWTVFTAQEMLDSLSED